MKGKGKWTTHGRFNHEIYATINESFIFCNKLSKSFRGSSIVINPYDVFVLNQEINDKQMTVLFIDDYLMVNYIDHMVLINYVKTLNEIPGTQNPLTITWVKMHK